MDVKADIGDDKAAGAATQGSESAEALRWRPKRLTGLGLAVVLIAVSCGLASFVVLTGMTPIVPTRKVVLSLMALNGVLVLVLASLVGWQLASLLIARRRGIAGAVLHARIVGLFSLFAAVPAIIVAVFATVTLNRGLDAWFSQRTQSIVSSAVTVAEAYIAEQGDVARTDVAAISQDLDRQLELFNKQRQIFIRRLAALTSLRSLSAAFVVNRAKKRVEAAVTANNRIQFRPPDDSSFAAAAKGNLVVVGPGKGNVIRALVKLKGFPDHYLYVYRLVNPLVIKQLAKARAELAEYQRLREQRAGVQLTFAFMYAGVAFIFLLAAVWFGLWFADRLVEPIVSLVHGARRVSRGDLDAKVVVSRGAGDLATLGQTFNQMTSQLKTQHDELTEAAHKLDERRRFSEAVLAGVSAGVIGLGPDLRINLVNRSATRLLERKSADLIGRRLDEVLSDFADVLDQAINKASGSSQGQVNMRIGEQERSFVVRATTERSSEDEHGYVLTFDDITDLVAAQRTSAWADIARRIAHEIKNPLTPIQLSAERLKRKYAREISTDPQVFAQCTDTIIRQVEDIGRMVDEFSSFARMPSAVLERHDLAATVKEAVMLQRVAHEGIAITVDIGEAEIDYTFDRRLVSQALINVIKNAQESIEARLAETAEPPGRIDVVVARGKSAIDITVTDNGLGLPRENRARLTEPYMTTREKGTGLGLAIVKRILEEHGGSLHLEDATGDDGRGARIVMSFPLKADGKSAQATAKQTTAKTQKAGKKASVIHGR